MINEELIEKLREHDENFAGYVIEQEKSMFGTPIKVVGVTTLTHDEIKDIISESVQASEVQTSLTEGSVPEHQGSQQGDEVKQLFMGRIKTTDIQPNSHYKFENPDGVANVKEWYREFRFLAPIVVDRELKVIDGNIRLQIALNSETEYVSVVVLDTEAVKSDGLRLSLNRTSEFQRWNYEEVDEYVDEYPQLQPILEPIGFFSNNVLPVSFFSGTVMNYKRDMYNDQQQKYMQDEGLEQWAEIMRHRNEKLNKQRVARQKDYSRHKGLLNIKFDKSDLRPTYDVDEALKTNVEQMTTIADRVTKNFDEQNAKVIEESGRKWQNTRRSSRQKAADKRAAAEKSKRKGE